MSEKKQTVNEGLGISEEWDAINERRLKNDLSDTDTISDAMESAIRRIKSSEFGDDSNYEISEYEKKIMYSGWALHSIMSEARMQSSGGPLMGSILGDILGKMRGEEE